MRQFFVVVVFVATLLAGCVGPDAPVAASTFETTVPPILLARVSDAQGDAVENGAAFALEVSRGNCGAGSFFAVPTCRSMIGTLAAAVDSEPGPGLPAPPPLDLIEVRMEETTTDVQVIITVASIAENFADAVGDDASRSQGTTWAVCWDERSACAGLAVQLNNGVLVAQSFMEREQPGCGPQRWFWCGWSVPYDVTFGTPATITLDIPRDVLADGDAGGTLSAPIGLSLRAERTGERVDHWVGVTDVGTAGHTARRVFVLADKTAHGEPMTLTLPQGTPRVWEPVRMLAGDDVSRTDIWGERQDVDMLEQHLIEDPRSLTIATRFVEVPRDPLDSDLLAFFGLEGEPLTVIGASAVDGVVTPWGFRCVEDACDVVDVVMERTIGAGGWVNLTLLREEVGNPVAGTLIEHLLVNARTSGHSEVHSVGPVWGGVSAAWIDDWNRLFPPYRLRVDSAD